MNEARPPWVTMDLINLLVDAMLALPFIDDSHFRAAVLRLMDLGLREEDPTVRLHIARSDVPRLAVVNIIEAVVRQRGAIAALAKAVGVMAKGDVNVESFIGLCDRVAKLEPGHLDEATHGSLMDALAGLATSMDLATLFATAIDLPLSNATAATYRGAVAQLAGKASPVPLFRFLEVAAADSVHTDAADDLRRWIDSHIGIVPPEKQAEIATLRRWLIEQGLGGPARPFLLISLDRVNDDQFSILAWLSQDGRQMGPNLGPDDIVNRRELCVWLGTVLQKHVDGALSPTRDALIEFLLPPGDILMPVDAWAVTVAGETYRLGSRYRVVVRPATRIGDAMSRLARRWEITTDIMATDHVAADVARWVPSTDDENDLHEATDWAWLAITCPNVAVSTKALDLVVGSGSPIALWLRGRGDEQARREVLSSVAEMRSLDELPDAVWRFRMHGWNRSDDVRRDLVLLWDDPTRTRPDDLRLTAPRGVRKR